MKIINQIKFLFTFLIVSCFGQIIADNKIVYLISSPRSSLVEFLRMVGNRGDFKVMHIPGNWAYCHAHNQTEIVKGWYREDAPATYGQAKEDIVKEAEKSNVFVGENTHTAKEFLAENKEFLTDSKIQFVFLLRDLHGAIIDYYDKKRDIFDKLPPTQVCESMGLKDLYNIFLTLQNANNSPFIIKSEDLYAKPRETVLAVCDFLNVPFKEDALHWKDISENFTTFEAEGWYTIELTDCSKKWHGDALKSTGFSQPKKYAIDENGYPTFEEIENLAHREICIQAYKKNLIYYNKLVGR